MSETKSLTDPPKNLKEAIDWLALVGGGYGGSAFGGLGKHTELEKALKQLEGFTTATDKVSGLSHFSGLILNLGHGLGRGFLGYDSNVSFGSGGIVKKDGAYQSTYKDADWEHNDDTNYAKIFLFLAPLVYYFVSFFYWMCKKHWHRQQLQYRSTLGLYYLFNAMGFPTTQLDEKKNGSEIAKHLEGHDCFDELSAAYETDGKTSYDAFLSTLETNGPTKKLDYPLTNCMRFSYAYLQSKQKGKDITDAIDAVKGELVRLSKRDNSSNTNDFSKLTRYISTLLSKIKSFDPNIVSSEPGSASTRHPGSSEPGSDGPQKAGSSGTGSTPHTSASSSSGPAVGGFLGVGALGAGVAYGLNLGKANGPLERLRDAVLGFWLGALSQVSRLLNGKKTEKDDVDKVVSKIMGAFGKGKEGVNGLAESVDSLSSAVQGSGVQGVTEILEALKEGISDLKTHLSSSELKTLAGAVVTYLTKVLTKVESDADTASSKVQQLKSDLPAVVKQLKSQTNKPIDLGESGIKTELDAVNGNSSGSNTQLGDLIKKDQIGDTKAKKIVNAVWCATSYFVDVLKTRYTSSYPSSATWQSVGGNQATCAKIFLACLPVIFNGLNYLYWKFSGRGGGWNAMTLGSPEPKAFMGIMTDKSRLFNGNTSATEIVSTAFQNFKEFTNAVRESATSYADFLKKFRGNCFTNWKGSSDANENFLSGLYLCSTSYFRHQHQKKAATARPPSSIREMLYWLMGLTATPQFGDLLGHIHNVVGSDLKVAVSGSSKTGETLSPDQVTYILSTCYSSPSVLNIIQGSLAFNTLQDEPWLHALYSNDAFSFMYPSPGAALFYALSDYTYALQFQLSFLYKQCQDMYINTCGWQFCTFGKDINKSPTKQIVSSHICSVGCTTGGHSSGDHATGPCEHKDCGQASGKPSPLQAFLTDKLKGFSRSHPSDPSSHLASCSGSTCHVPMGFESHLRPDKGPQGGHISLTLKPFCGSHNTPLRQLCGTLMCLSKRTPRSLGDLFGFYWQVTGQLFNDVKTKNGDPSNDLSNAFTKLLLKLTAVKSGLLYESLSTTVESIGSHFFGLSWHCHRKHSWQTVKRSNATGYCDDHSNSNKACDLMSLYDSEFKDKTCGKYLEPIGISSGATFADKYAFNYFSWATYLTDELYDSLQEFLESFNGLKCTGCKNNCSSHSSGSHGTKSSWHCRSVVECSDVLPHLYSNGFHFHNAFWLRGRYYKNSKWEENANKRTCANFHTQLQSVISGEPLSNLLTSIDEFLYLFRYYFLGNLSTFWTIYIGLILYAFFFMLDTLHLRSHLKLTSSHTVPPLALLSSGQPPAITKLAYIGQ
ncbi:variant erythrocyte surface antigen-1 family protein [Babesia caballi]|uniref:Variant erythrocyte surface antigen-1 family protein n=1 Tax=Babesia caballi TaxID=5871 RepID=A0AAV4M270_BABCB|nr:variant erythrocyte surface antigen-1 family protein [Babesia caballi]